MTHERLVGKWVMTFIKTDRGLKLPRYLQRYADIRAAKSLIVVENILSLYVVPDGPDRIGDACWGDGVAIGTVPFRSNPGGCSRRSTESSRAPRADAGLGFWFRLRRDRLLLWRPVLCSTWWGGSDYGRKLSIRVASPGPGGTADSEGSAERATHGSRRMVRGSGHERRESHKRRES
jgi:hypothetical protein